MIRHLSSYRKGVAQSRDPLSDLIFIVLSRMTQEERYLRSFQALKRRFSTWELLRDAYFRQIERMLKASGLARSKAAGLKRALAEITRREGRLSLRRLSNLTDSQVEDYLASLPGVGRKSAKCVMLYTLNRDVLPVDAHVWRVARRLGWLARTNWSERESLRLEAAVPPQSRASLHVTILAHGRKVCTARSPKCEICILAELCPSAKRCFGQLEAVRNYSSPRSGPRPRGLLRTRSRVAKL